MNSITSFVCGDGKFRPKVEPDGTIYSFKSYHKGQNFFADTQDNLCHPVCSKTRGGFSEFRQTCDPHKQHNEGTHLQSLPFVSVIVSLYLCPLRKSLSNYQLISGFIQCKLMTGNLNSGCSDVWVFECSHCRAIKLIISFENIPPDLSFQLILLNFTCMGIFRASAPRILHALSSPPRTKSHMVPSIQGARK